MTQKQNLKLTLLAGLFLASLGGFLLHLRAHPLSESSVHLIPFLSGLVSLVLIPALFLYRPAVPYAYVVNGMLVIVGTITMAHLSITRFAGGVTFTGIAVKSMLGNIILLWTKFFFGKALFDLEYIAPEAEMRHGRFFRYPNMGWWWVHLIAMSAVYALGNVLWQ